MLPLVIFSFIIPYSVHFRQYLILTKKSLILTNQNALPSSNISSCHKIVRTPCYTNRKSKTRSDNTWKFLSAKDLCKSYGSGENSVQALNHVSISVENGEFVAVIGTSGSGKSTLLNLLGGLDTPTSGEVLVSGKKLFQMNEEARTIFRRRNIGFVFQNYNLVPVLNVYENIVLPIELDGTKVDTEYVKTILHTLGLEQKVQAMPNQLSGGQQQRVAIARALAAKPAILLADEPTGNLDSKTGMDVIALLKMTSQAFHQTIVMITHNEEIALMADRMIRIEDGKVVNGNAEK